MSINVASPGRFAMLLGAALFSANAGCDMAAGVSNKSSPDEQRSTSSNASVPDRQEGLPSPQPESQSGSRPAPERPSLGNDSGQTLAPVDQKPAPADVARERPGLPAGSRRPNSSQPRMLARLSAGVALPQMLPTGTTMGFSVDYVLTGSLPTSGAGVVWVIESTKGGRTEIPVRLKNEGNLMTYAQGVRPEQGPFRSHLALVLPNGHRQPISPEVAMKSP